MQRIADFAWLLLPFLVYVECSKEKEKLKCYQCAVDDNKLCTDEFLKPCGDDQAYDSCMTRISKTKSDGFLIRKNCALAPCTLRDPRQSSGLGLDDCDQSKDEYDCISCCKTDGCNEASGAISCPKNILIALFVISSFLYLTRQ